MKSSTTPWCEKYRPTNFSNIVLEPQTRIIFGNILKSAHFPHLLLYGPPGAGKTTSAENLIKQYQKQYHRINRETVMHLNASDERGIEVIRNQIHQFVKSNNMFEKGYKFVILDEVDYMTKNAQQALKNLVQCCDKNVIFCLICNYICKLDDSLKNEFICIRFNHLPGDEIKSFIQNIAKQENIVISDGIIENIQDMFHNDIRSMVNFIQLHHTDPQWNDYLFGKSHWEELHQLFVVGEKSVIVKWINEFTCVRCNMDVKTCLKKYFNFMILNHQERVNKKFLDICENILHCNTHEFTLPYFIEQILNEYKIEII